MNSTHGLAVVRRAKPYVIVHHTFWMVDALGWNVHGPLLLIILTSGYAVNTASLVDHDGFVNEGR